MALLGHEYKCLESHASSLAGCRVSGSSPSSGSEAAREVVGLNFGCACGACNCSEVVKVSHSDFSTMVYDGNNYKC